MIKYLEDFNLGEKHTTQARTITEGALAILEGLAGYCAPFMIDEEYAKTTVFHGRVAPGRLTLLMMGGLIEMSGGAIFGEMEDGLLVGINNIKFRNPLRAGDTIRVEMEVIEKRETKNPERGLLIHKEICKNQRDEVVAEAETLHLIRRKPQQ